MYYTVINAPLPSPAPQKLSPSFVTQLRGVTRNNLPYHSFRVNSFRAYQGMGRHKTTYTIRIKWMQNHRITQHRQYRCRDAPALGGGVTGAKYACTLMFGRCVCKSQRENSNVITYCKFNIEFIRVVLALITHPKSTYASSRNQLAVVKLNSLEIVTGLQKMIEASVCD